MSGRRWTLILSVAGVISLAPGARAQRNPHIGFVYPAGGQQGTTFQIRLGGQRLVGLEGAIVSGSGVQAKLIEYRYKMSPQDRTYLNEQLKILRQKHKLDSKGKKGKSYGNKGEPAPMMEMMAEDMDMMMAAMDGDASGQGVTVAAKTDAEQMLMDRIQTWVKEWCNRPADASLSEIAILEVTVDKNAKPGARELRLVTERGLSNPLKFHIGQFPEVARRAMKTQPFQVLGKEHLAQRNRQKEEVEVEVKIPCTMNGEIASGEVNRYRFTARKGQNLVISVAARELIPFIADGVPGWFQPILSLHDANGNEVAYNDDFRFKPDPTILHKVEKDGEYVLTIADAIYRGREDFVYRITVAESPFVTSIFPLGGHAGKVPQVTMEGWNLGEAKLMLPASDSPAGVRYVAANREGLLSNYVPFMLSYLPEQFEKEPNSTAAEAVRVRMPVMINGRMNHAGDWDVFRVEGKAGQTIVAEVHARRLGSPMDAVLQIVDAKGNIIAVNDDRGTPGSGLNTHHADSYLMAKLPADGNYDVRLGDTERKAGKAYAYRLRISPPRPDFELRTVPSCVGMKTKSGGNIEVFAVRKDGFKGPIKVTLASPPEGFSAKPVTIGPGKEKVRLSIRNTLGKKREPLPLKIKGTAQIWGKTATRLAVPTEDKMQAFLWRHLVPAEAFMVRVWDGTRKVKKRPLPEVPELATVAAATDNAADGDKPKPKFSQKQITQFTRVLDRLHAAWLITDEFYLRKHKEFRETTIPATQTAKK